MSGASLTHLTYVNDGEPYFIRSAPIPPSTIISSSTRLFSPVLVIPSEGTAIGPIVTTITNTPTGPLATFGVTTIATNTFNAGMSIPNQLNVNMVAGDPSIGFPETTIQNWNPTNTIVYKPMLIQNDGANAILTLQQGTDGGGYTELLGQSTNPLPPDIRFYNSGRLTMNSTITMSSTINVHAVGNNNNTNLESNGISGTTAGGIPWIVEQIDSVGGLVINADTANGQPPGIIAYNDGSVAISRLNLTNGISGTTTGGIPWVVAQNDAVHGLVINADTANGQPPNIIANNDGSVNICGSSINFATSVVGLSTGIIQINSINSQEYSQLFTTGMTGNNVFSNQSWTILKDDGGPIYIDSNRARNLPLGIENNYDTVGNYERLFVPAGAEIKLRDQYTNSLIDFNSTITMTNNLGLYSVVSTPAITIKAIGTGQYINNTAYGLDGNTAGAVNWNVLGNDNGVGIDANTANGFGPNIQALQDGQTIINSTVVFSAPIADNQVNFKQDTDTNGNYLSLGLSNGNTIDSPEIRMNKDSGNISINSTITFTNNPLPIMNIYAFDSQANNSVSYTGMVGTTAAGYNWQMKSTDSVGGITINANTVGGQAPNILAFQDGTTVISRLQASTFSVSSFEISNIALSTIAVSTLTANSIDCSTIAVSTLTAKNIGCSTLAVSTLTANNIGCSTLAVSTLTGNSIAYSTIAVSTLTGNSIACSTIAVSTLTTNNIGSSTMTVSSIGATNIGDLRIDPGTLIIANNESYNTNDRTPYFGSQTQITNNAIISGGFSTELINYGYSYPNSGFAFYNATPGDIVSKISTFATILLELVSSKLIPTLRVDTIICSTITNNSVTGFGLIPTGGLLQWAAVASERGNQPTPPVGYLYCNGTSYLQADYPNLYAVIGTNYGSGSAGNTFQVPDLRLGTTFGAISSSDPQITINTTYADMPGTIYAGKCVYVNSTNQPLIVGMNYQSPPVPNAITYVIDGFIDFNGMPGSQGIMYMTELISYSPPYITSWNNLASVCFTQGNAPNGVVGTNDGNNAFLQQARHVGAHFHGGSANQASTALNGDNNLTNTSNNTGFNDDLTQYTLNGVTTYSNINYSMATKTYGTAIWQLIKT